MSKLRNSTILHFEFLILHSRGAGFTLVEIMIAIAVIGVVLMAVLNTINYHANVAYEHTLTTKMIFMAREKITEMETDPQNTTGVIPGTDFKYENLVNKIEDDGIIELKTIISGDNKKVVLSELVTKKEKIKN